MPFVPALHVARFQMFFDNYGEPAQNTVHIVHYSASPWTSLQLSTKTAALANWWEVYLSPLTNSGVSLVSVLGTDLTSEFAMRYEHVPTPAIPGDYDGTPLPQNCTVVISSHTGGRGRSYNGRTYFVGLSAQFCEDGYIVTERANSLVNAFHSLLDLINDASYAVCLLSYQHDNVLLPTAAIYPIQAYSCGRELDSQRRRLPGR